MKELLDLSVIIPTRNRLQLLRQTIASICSGKGVPGQLVIVDQSDRQLQDKDLMDLVPEGTQMLIIHMERPSLTAARNTGISRSQYETVLFLDDDVLLGDKTLTALCLIFEDSKVALAAAPDAEYKFIAKRYPDLLGIVCFRKKPFKRYGYVCKGAVLGRYPDDLEESVPTEWAMGYFFAVRRELFFKYGLKFDENLSSYGYAEDLDFSYSFIKKAIQEGYSAILAPELYVRHLGSSERRIFSKKATNMYVMHRYYLSYKHFKGPIKRVILVWSDIGEFFRRLIKGENPVDILTAHIMCIRKLKKLRAGIIDAELQNMVR